MDSDGIPITTLGEQRKLERKVSEVYGKAMQEPDALERVELQRSSHLEFLHNALLWLPEGYAVLDASRPWICYWIVHSMALLGERPDPMLAERCVDTLKRFQHPHGGFGGGPGQLAHLAASYAATCALVTVGGNSALTAVNRKCMYNFLMRMKEPSGGFRMHEGGEMDVRGCYTAMATAHLLDIVTPELTAGVGSFVSSCQTYEGGIGGEPGTEAHGGYTFCGLAAAMLANQSESLDLPSLLQWAVALQGEVEGGFQGRTNKLVDGCYSHWVGGLFPLLRQLMPLLQLQQRQQYVSGTRSTQSGTGSLEEANGQPGGSRSSSESSKVETGESTSVSSWPSTCAASLFSGQSQAPPPARSVVILEEIEEDEETAEGAERHQDADAAHSAQGSHKFGTGTGSGGDQSEPEVEGGWDNEEILYNTQALQGYLLFCCQANEGGLIDKPGTHRDFYHTCYGLSGLSSAQHLHGAFPPRSAILGIYSNVLEQADPLCNIHLPRYREATKFYTSNPIDLS